MVAGTQSILNNMASYVANNLLKYITIGRDDRTIQLSTDDILDPVNIQAGQRNKEPIASGITVTNNNFKVEFRIVATEPVTQPVNLRSFGVSLTPGTVNVMLDNCDTSGGWAATSDAIATQVDITGKVEGIGSLKMGKSGTGSTQFGYSKTLGATYGGTGKRLVASVKASDLTDIDTTVALRIEIGSDATNVFYKTYPASTISTLRDSDGWFTLSEDVTGSVMSVSGSPAINSLDYLKVAMFTDTTGKTVTLGTFNFDDIHLVTDVTGDLQIGFIYPVKTSKVNTAEFTARVSGSVIENV